MYTHVSSSVFSSHVCGASRRERSRERERERYMYSLEESTLELVCSQTCNAVTSSLHRDKKKRHTRLTETGKKRKEKNSNSSRLVVTKAKKQCKDLVISDASRAYRDTAALLLFVREFYLGRGFELHVTAFIGLKRQDDDGDDDDGRRSRRSR